LPTRVQNFIEISRHLAMLWQKCIGLVFLEHSEFRRFFGHSCFTR